MKATVADILEHKGHFVLQIESGSTVYRAIKQMVEHDVGSILVADEGEPRGIFTERDYLKKIILKGRRSKTTPVDEVMTKDIVVVDPDYDVEECMAIMTEEKFRHLIVMGDGEITGIISIGDCVKQMSRHAEARVQYLRDYITGTYPN